VSSGEGSIMVNPRYDAENDESKHGAVSPDDCLKMRKKYGWDLKRIVKTNRKTLEYDCVFKGETEFPRPYHETETTETTETKD
jgi:hypothetical protein